MLPATSGRADRFKLAGASHFAPQHVNGVVGKLGRASKAVEFDSEFVRDLNRSHGECGPFVIVA